jgi:8-oxo-dGTP diphosphatase
MHKTDKNQVNGVRDYGYSIPIDDFFTCALSVDCAIFGFDGESLKVLLIQRGAEPFIGKWALPGDLMYPDENLDDASSRVLKDLTGIDNLFIEQMHAFGRVNRHPTGRVITVSYYALVKIQDYNPQASSWADQLEWHDVTAIPELAFDHKSILENTLEKFRERMRMRPIGFEMLPAKFTLNDIQVLYEQVLDKKFDKGNFRKKILSTKALIPLEESRVNVSHRPAKLYKLNQEVTQDTTFEI